MRVHNHGFDPACREIQTLYGLKGECMVASYSPVLAKKLTTGTTVSPNGATDVNPPHYDFPGGVQVIHLTKHLDFLIGNVVKYVCRAGRKGDRLTDLLKAKQYLDWAIEKEQTNE